MTTPSQTDYSAARPQVPSAFHADTIVASATPLGESALAIIRFTGPDSLALSQSIFELTTPPQPRQAYLGHYKNISYESVDQTVFIYFESGRSFTGESMLEIHTHGNPWIVHKILEDAISRGCRLAEPGEFTKRAFLNGKMDLAQAEAVADMIHAKSDQALRIAQRQLAGELGQKVAYIIDEILNVSAHIEAYIDFPDEDLPSEDTEGPRAILKQLISTLESLIQTQRYHARVHQGLKTVIVGAPNAGKSSLLNALLGLERAIVSPEPGTTRDFITEMLHVGPHLLQLIDTAGIRRGLSAVESLGIERTFQKIAEADLILWVVDGSQSPSRCLAAADLLNHLAVDNTLVVANKADLGFQAEWEAFCQGYVLTKVSLKDLSTTKELTVALQQLIEERHLIPPAETFIVNARHAEALVLAKKHLDVANNMIYCSHPAELVAAELRLAIDAVAQIVGRIDQERMLDKLFSQFCIGK